MKWHFRKTEIYFPFFVFLLKMMNPMLQKTITKRPTFPIKVVFVYKEPFDRNDPIFRKIRDFCGDLNIEFQPREYDSEIYRHDRDNVTRVPAIHLYEKDRHEKTFYPEIRPIQIIFQSYEKFHSGKEKTWSLKRLFS